MRGPAAVPSRQTFVRSLWRMQSKCDLGQVQQRLRWRKGRTKKLGENLKKKEQKTVY